MRPPWKTIITTLGKFAIPAAIIAYLVWRIEPEQWHELTSQPKDYLLLSVALVVALVAMSVSFARWCLLVRCQGIELTMLEAFRLGAICFLLSFVSAGSVGGDVFKAIFLAQRRPGKRVEAVASVFVDRGVGLYGLLLLVAITLLVTDPPQADADGLSLDRIKLITAILVGIGTIVLAVLVLGGRGIDALIFRASKWKVVGPAVNRLGPPIRTFHAHPVAFGASIVMSVTVHSLFALSMFLIARGLYSSPPTLTEHFVIVPVGLLVSALPLTPAGLGLLEAAMAKLYQLVPAAPTEASGTLVALVFEIVKLVMAMIGTVFYWTANEEVRQSLEYAEDEAAGDAHTDGQSSPSESSGFEDSGEPTSTDDRPLTG